MIPTSIGALYDFHVARAEAYFKLYYDLQEQIEQMEAVAKRAARNSTEVKVLLEKTDKFGLHPSGRTYVRMCKLRDAYMSAASLSASMAGMYATILQRQ